MNARASIRVARALAAVALLALPLAGQAVDPHAGAQERLMADVRALAADAMGGRQTGTPGGARARAYLVEAFERIGLQPLGEAFTHPFALGADRAGTGVNVLGVVPGRVEPDAFLVLSAHYDHMGVRDGKLHPGADDNASGVAGLLEIARRFAADPPAHSILFAAFDAEEIGLRGAKAFVADPPVPLAAIRFVVNLDMIGRSAANELYLAGLAHRPWIGDVIDGLEPPPPLRLRFGHDRPGAGDWTLSSDHGPFHQAGVPFLYFGVEDHAGYHRPSDTPDALTVPFYAAAVETVYRTLRLLDAQGKR